MKPEVSIIIPTHNRRARLERTLSALVEQTYPAHRMEVIVVMGDGTDGTVAMVEGFEAPFPVHLLRHPSPGPAAKRNVGALEARGDLLVFVDDDILLERGCIEAHVRAHREDPCRVVIGYFPPTFETSPGFFQLLQRDWWEDHFDRLRDEGRRRDYRDVVSGNLSVGAELFSRVGGFDTSLTARDDHELGLRLLEAGADLFHSEAAEGRHCESSDVGTAARRKRQEGRCDVILGERYPELRPTLPPAGVARAVRGGGRLFLRIVLVHVPPLGRAFSRLARGALPVFEALRMRRIWRRALDMCLTLEYCRGASEELRDRGALDRFLEVPPGLARADTEMTLDLGRGLGHAQAELDRHRPRGVRLLLGRHLLGDVQPIRGMERLKGAHLPRLLAEEFAAPLLVALASIGTAHAPARGQNPRDAFEPLERALETTILAPPQQSPGTGIPPGGEGPTHRA